MSYNFKDFSTSNTGLSNELTLQNLLRSDVDLFQVNKFEKTIFIFEDLFTI